MSFWGVSILSFMAGGGILILLMVISMMHARISNVKHSPEEAKEASRKESLAVVPLAISFWAGPGVISTVILCAHQAVSPLDRLIFCAVIAFIGFTVWVVLHLSGPISERLGATGITIVVHLMGLIPVSIAVDFMAKGLTGLFPGLVRDHQKKMLDMKYALEVPL